MFLIELTYKVPLARIDAHMAEHVVFLKKHYAAGHFLVSGRKIPREGGIILALGTTRDQIQTIVERAGHAETDRVTVKLSWARDRCAQTK